MNTLSTQHEAEELFKNNQLLGVFNDVPNDVYHKLPGISPSGLSLLHRGPAAFKRKREASKAMFIGTLTHNAILEPGKTDGLFVVQPKQMNRKGEKNRLELEAWERAQKDAGRAIVSDADMSKVNRLVSNVRANPEAMHYIENSNIEQTYIWDDQVKCRFKADLVYEKEQTFVLDLKTTISASRTDFGNSIFEYLYDVQAYFNKSGYETVTGKQCDGFKFIAVDESRCQIFDVDEKTMEIGAFRAKKLLEEYARLITTDDWYKPINYTIPYWIEKQIEREEASEELNALEA